MSAAVTLRDVSVRFPISTPWRTRIRGGRRTLDAVLGVDLEVAAGRSMGIVGESGSGKSTLARLITGLQAPTSGTVGVAGSGGDGRRATPRVQMVFQDPSSSLDPRQRVGDAIAEVLRVHRVVDRAAIEGRVHLLLDQVGLPRSAATCLPRHLSGGQRQRVAIARALANEPAVLVADEAVASLDVSVKAGVLNLLRDLQHELGLTLVLITHDLATVGHACDDIAVMYLGRIVERGPADAVLTAAAHPYTRALLAAAPRLHSAIDRRPVVVGEPPSPTAPPSGCAFRTRCPFAEPRCADQVPELREVHGRHVRCHLDLDRT